MRVSTPVDAFTTSWPTSPRGSHARQVRPGGVPERAQYLDDEDATKAIDTLATRLSRVVAVRCADGRRPRRGDRSRPTDLDVHWRTGDWYRKRLSAASSRSVAACGCRESAPHVLRARTGPGFVILMRIERRVSSERRTPRCCRRSAAVCRSNSPPQVIRTSCGSPSRRKTRSSGSSVLGISSTLVTVKGPRVRPRE